MSATVAVRPFDLAGPLPTGVTLLEAGAGTGKTATIAALATRYVADGTPLERLLLVTFTRMATGELRERVRERLARTLRGLDAVARGAPPDPDDPVLRVLVADGAAAREVRRHRLAAALADFDGATIATIHGFCSTVLRGMGVAGDVDTDVELVEDLEELVGEVVDDLYVRGFAVRTLGGDATAAPPFPRSEALRIARVATSNAGAALEPSAVPPTSPDGLRRRFAQGVRNEVERRKRARGLLTYDDLLVRLAGVLEDPVRGRDARARLRRRFDVALVDEFQDTDPAQWEILRRAFVTDEGARGRDGDRGDDRGGVRGDGGDGHGDDVALVLIGDPKQAIYAFRGADVYAYLEAAATPGAVRADLAQNHRTDAPLLEAYDALFGDAQLGHPGIRYRPVVASPGNRQPRVVGAPRPEPLRVRVVHRDDDLVPRSRSERWLKLADTRALVAADLAADVVELLRSEAELRPRAPDGRDLPARAVRPDDVAVLVRTHRQASAVRDALDAVGVPAVLNGAGSVFGTAVARDWLRLLEALERPSVPLFARAAALTAFLGWTPADVAAADDDAWEDVHARLHRWAGVLRRRGVAALLEVVTATERLPGRLLARTDGERVLTDLRHVAQLLHGEASEARLGPSALTAWLRQRIADAATDTGAEERSRRLESDGRAVQVLTIHRSKGLEFPVVYCPSLCEAGYLDERDGIPAYHDPAHGDRRTIDVGREHAGRDASWARYVEEQRGEDLRLAYVALTRARHVAVLWWAATWDARCSPLGRLLFGRGDDGCVLPELADGVPDDDVAVAALTALEAARPGRIGVERVGVPATTRWEPPREDVPTLDVRSFTRTVDRTWRRTSYTDLTADAHAGPGPVVGSEPEIAVARDEAGDAAAEAVDGALALRLPAAADGATPDHETGDVEAALRAVASPLDAMARGPEVGTLVHAALEEADWHADDLDAELRRALALARRRHPVPDLGDEDVVVHGLRAALETPLGPLVGDLRLADVPRGDRVDELWFELPLDGGDVPRHRTSPRLDAVAAVLRAHLAPDDPFGGYPDVLEAADLQGDLRGYLTGSIDAVLRVPGDRGPRFVVVDHKTNRLARADEPLTAWHHRPEALVAAMQSSHYPLQAILYVVALHRYLRWRLGGYDPAQHLGGVLYCFVRGMVGADVPRVDGQPCGVAAWSPPAALVVALSDLLDRGEAVR